MVGVVYRDCILNGLYKAMMSFTMILIS